MVTVAMKLKELAPWEKSYYQPRQHIKKANITLQNTPKKTTKLDKIFGDDAMRIKREAAKISDGGKQSGSRGGKNSTKVGKKSRKG